MPSLDEISQEAAYAAGDPWTPGDPNQVAIHSGTVRDVGLVAHRGDGTHRDLNIPLACAIITLTAGPTYTVTKGYNITTGTGSITINGTGNVSVKLDTPVSAATTVGVDVRPNVTDNAEFGYQDATGTNDTQYVTIQLFDGTPAAVDRSFWIAIYGIREA